MVDINNSSYHPNGAEEEEEDYEKNVVGWRKKPQTAYLINGMRPGL